MLGWVLGLGRVLGGRVGVSGAVGEVCLGDFMIGEFRVFCAYPCISRVVLMTLGDERRRVYRVHKGSHIIGDDVGWQSEVR